MYIMTLKIFYDKSFMIIEMIKSQLFLYKVKIILQKGKVNNNI